MTFERERTGLSTADLAGTRHTHDAQTIEEPHTNRDAFDRDVPPQERVSDSTPVVQSSQDAAERTPAADTTMAARSNATHATTETTPLFSAEEAQQYRARWTDTQAGFVDEPRRAVEDADSLVAEVMKRLAESFAQERTHLESQWDRGDNIDTEQLRLALRRYRSFFDRLLAV